MYIVIGSELEITNIYMLDLNTQLEQTLSITPNLCFPVGENSILSFSFGDDTLVEKVNINISSDAS